MVNNIISLLSRSKSISEIEFLTGKELKFIDENAVYDELYTFYSHNILGMRFLFEPNILYIFCFDDEVKKFGKPTDELIHVYKCEIEKGCTNINLIYLCKLEKLSGISIKDFYSNLDLKGLIFSDVNAGTYNRTFLFQNKRNSEEITIDHNDFNLSRCWRILFDYIQNNVINADEFQTIEISLTNEEEDLYDKICVILSDKTCQKNLAKILKSAREQNSRKINIDNSNLEFLESIINFTRIFTLSRHPDEIPRIKVIPISGIYIYEYIIEQFKIIVQKQREFITLTD